MFKQALLGLALLFACAVSPAGAQPPSSDSSLCVWPWLVGNVDGSVPTILSQMQATGQDAIYLHLYRTTGPQQGTLHMVDEAGNWPAALGPTDPDVTLSTFLSQAHAQGIQVIGVIGCFLDGGPLPDDLGHTQHLLAVIREILGARLPDGRPRYPLDGIALDRVRYYSSAPSGPAPVNNFVQAVRDEIAPLPLHAFVPANAFHIDGPPYDASFRSYNNAMSLLSGQFGHDWESLFPLLDVVLPMAYVAEGGVYGNNTALMQAYVRTAAVYARQAALLGGVPDLRIQPAIRTWNDSSGTTTAASVSACISGALQGSAQGFCQYRYFTSLGQTSWWNAIAPFSTPGADLPLARLDVTQVAGLTAELRGDASTGTGLEYRFDLDGDGTSDTPWSPAPSAPLLVAARGSWPAGVEVRDGGGRRAGYRRDVPVLNDVLTVDAGLFFLSLGGTITFDLDFGPGAAFGLYAIGASASGSSPGTPLPTGVVLPLNWDLLSELTILWYETSLLRNFIGPLDVDGRAQARLVAGAGVLPPELAWNTLTFACAAAPWFGPELLVSESRSVFLFP